MEKAMKVSLQNLFKKNKTKLKIDLILHGNGIDRYSCKEEWTDESKAELIKKTYRRCKGFKEGSDWFNVPVYMRLIGFHEYDGGIKETSFTYDDYYRSNALDKFKRGLSKIARGQIDGKMVGVIAVVIVIVIGCVFLFMGNR